MNELNIYCEDKLLTPQRAHITDAGLDLKAKDTYNIQWGKSKLVGTGVYVEIPKGHVGLIFPRSGMAVKKGISLANSVGVIDSDYRGEIKCALLYKDPTRCSGFYVIEKYERIAQLVIVPCLLPKLKIVTILEDLGNTKRGDGGFGSSD